MFIKLTVTIAFLFLCGPIAAATLDGCNLLLPSELEQLGVPKGATATADWSEKDGKHLCTYAQKGTGGLIVAFSKATDETIRAVEQRTAVVKRDVSRKDAQSYFDAAFGESSVCGSSAVADVQAVSCWGVRNNVVLDFQIAHTALGDPKIKPAAPYLQVFNEVLSRVSTWAL